MRGRLAEEWLLGHCRNPSRQIAAGTQVALRGIWAVLLASALAGCGGVGDDDDWIFPFWVPTDIAVSDIDGDGRADVVTLAQLVTSNSQREGRLGVHFQLAGGGFAAAESYAVETYPWHFAIADVDGDGAPEVVVGDPDAQAVSWLRQDLAARGQLLAPVRLLSGVTPYDVAVADLDDDGAMDIVATDSTPRVVMLPQDPMAPGSFRPAVDVALPASSDGVAAADLDGDMLSDLAVGYLTPVTSTTNDNTLATLSQQAGGGFSAPQSLVTRRGLNLARLRLGDYDGDGTLDVIAYQTPSSSSFTAQLLAVVRPRIGAASVVETPLGGVKGLDDAAFGDFDADGRMDAAVAGTSNESRLNLFRQSPNGSLQLVEKRSLSIDVRRVATGDVDGDGNLDLVLLADEDRVLLMLQTAAGIGDFLAPQALP